VEQAGSGVNWVCVHLVGFQPTTVGLWQTSQLALFVGMWVEFCPMVGLLLWQVLQLVAAVNSAWLGFTPIQTDVETWQLSQLPVTVLWVVLAGLPVTPNVLGLVKWQVAHWADTETLGWNRTSVFQSTYPPL
jgi:hypothetical protein